MTKTSVGQTVSQQQQQQQQRQQQHQQQQSTSTQNYIKRAIDTATPSPPPPPVLRGPHHHRSITALPTLDLYDNYGGITLATTMGAHVQHTNQPSSRCKHHQQQAQQLQLQPESHHLQQHQYPCCSSYNIEHKMPQMHTCLCVGSKLYHEPPHAHAQAQANLRAPGPATTTPNTNRLYNQEFFCDSDHCLMHQFEEQESGLPGLRDQEFYLLHRNIPALRRTGIDTTGIRQHFFPDGGWGWIICGMSFLVHILTTGLQLSSGLTLFYAVQHIHNAAGNEWLGALNWSISMLMSPFVDTFCRRKSTRLLAVVGGLIMSLGVLFTSFATEVDQVIFSYGFIYGVGAAMVRETSTIMLGNYFKKRRLFVEMVAMSGEGVGIALFSVLLREGVGKVGWRCGLQIIAAICSISFFVGLLYRPASLYHPQRRAIQHLKNQRKKLRDHKVAQGHLEPNILKKIFQDISNLKSSTVKILLLISAVASLGIYTPMFTMAFNAAKEGSDVQELVLMQTILGMSITVGVVLAGALIRRPFIIRNFIISNAIISQFFIASVALTILFMSFVMSYKSLCILSGLYGVGFGGFRFSFKMLALERIKLKFSRTWSFLRGIEAIPVLISVPLTVFLNDYSLKYGRAGYYICSAATAIAAIIIFFLNQKQSMSAVPHPPENGIIPRLRSMSTQYGRGKLRSSFTTDYPKINGCDYMGLSFLNRSCVSLNQMDTSGPCLYSSPLRNQYQHGQHHRLTPFHSNPHVCLPTHVNEGSPDPYPGYQYNTNTSHYPRRTLSFLQNVNCCGSRHLQCNCPAQMQWSHRDVRMDTMQPFVCTCNSAMYTHNCRSQSVPEGLSTIGQQQCYCKAQPTREIIYIPQQPTQRLEYPCLHSRQSIRTKTDFNIDRQIVSTVPRCKLKRSQSCTRPLQFVEQMTTSV